VLDALTDIIAPFMTEAYYVGGCVRDCLLGRKIKDVDIAVAADPQAVGRAVQRALGGHFFWLRERDGTARVLSPSAGVPQLDIVPLTEPITADLRRRDYTVNAMAMPVAAGLHAGASVLDPTGGRADLAARRLRLAGPEALQADPLRALRGVRLALQLGFALEAETAARIREAGPWLSRVSRERIRDEFFLCLAAPASAEALRQMREYGLLAHAVPALQPVMDAAAWEPALARMEAVERFVDALPVAPPLGAHVRRHLARTLSPPRERDALLELGAFLGDGTAAAGAASRAEERRPRGTPLRKVGGLAARVGKELMLSGAEARWLSRLLSHSQAPFTCTGAGGLAGSAVYRFWRAAGDAAVDAVLILRAAPDARATAATLDALLERLLEYERGEHPPLLSGQEVMAVSGLAAGPALGALMDALAEAQADGLVRTAEEARRWIADRGASAPSA
jgi:poly(A) polymerase